MDDIFNHILQYIDKFDNLSVDSIAMIIVVSLVVIVCILICMTIKSEKKRKDLLIEHFDDILQPNDYYERELNDCYIELTIRLFEYHNKAIYTRDGKYNHSFLECRDIIRSKFKQMVTTQITKRKFFVISNVIVKFNPDFCNWILISYSDALLKDFYDVLLSYFDYLSNNDLIDLGIVFAEERVETIEVESKVDLVEEEPIIDESPALKMKHKVYVDTYNKEIQIIKNNNGRGLLPINTRHVTSEFVDYVSSRRVYSHQKFVAMCTSDLQQEDLGCYIIYNTYTNKYFVGKSKTPLQRAYAMVMGEVDSDSLLPYEFSLGHMVLVKIVPFVRSGYDDINSLQKALVKCYNSLYPDGYNQKVSKS